MTNESMKGKVAVITGGTTGIGLATAALFLQHGMKVVIAGRRQEEGRKALAQLRQISQEVDYVSTDVSQSEQVAQLIDTAVQLFGRLDVLFSNAGIEGHFGPIGDIAESSYDELMHINVKGVWLGAKYAVAQFKRQGDGGAIVNTSSWLARGAFAGSAIYSASKAALDAMTRGLAVELAAENIRVNNVQPGYIHTPMFDRFFPAENGEALMAPLRKHAPMGRFGTSEEVAELVLWLSSPAARFVTGESIAVDGGLAIGGQRM
ncbi:NAD(P)-dependent dehydrogenase (short-subunit alcohol dehydrogenase family) [Chitinophaga dinghuensis]|uniref:NAD(P)-dependent dehydrogenase (Short-subunit alcohol dehydrogenase family) n=1 Tax=Chitinophaga dinghuensis TaxID=1539050 RepID=A0A327W5X2_9BACT|nr:glucose 1-dehydrogenase [Chitinophaga dinghuensis]RAJ83565.1 NAD(P)-dependent dehydrogenase (short-subunit alcohol dehydrogenase family) [Chitinophaga dinghuensis]